MIIKAYLTELYSAVYVIMESVTPIYHSEIDTDYSCGFESYYVSYSDGHGTTSLMNVSRERSMVLGFVSPIINTLWFSTITPSSR